MPAPRLLAMPDNVSSMILSSIYNDWELNVADRRFLDSLGLDGAESLCAIHVALGQIFSHNPELAALWPTTPNKALNKLTPIEVMRRDGMDGVRRVRALVEQCGEI